MTLEINITVVLLIAFVMYTAFVHLMNYIMRAEDKDAGVFGFIVHIFGGLAFFAWFEYLVRV